MNLYALLKTLGIPCAYGCFKSKQTPPFIVYLGNGQDHYLADDQVYARKNTYRCEYYFRMKDESKEDAIEEALISNGFVFSKSEDTFIEDENVFVIYYDVWEI